VVKAGYGLYCFNGTERVPFFGSPSELADHVNLVNYTKERELHHDKGATVRPNLSNAGEIRDMGTKRKWTEATVLTAASFITKIKESPASHYAENRIMWDKSMSGANYFRYGICSWNEAICKFCVGKLETTSHKIAECKQADCVELREAAFRSSRRRCLRCQAQSSAESSRL
jgi:hypothetical protein